MTRSLVISLAFPLFLSACPGDGGDTNETTTTETSNGTTTAPSTGDPTTVSASDSTTDTPTTVPTTSTASDPTTDTDPTGEMTSTTDATTTTEGTTEAEETTDAMTTADLGDCGNGILEDGEVCDDGNNVTELSQSNGPPLQYEADACIDNCGLVLSLCGNGEVDPGEECDDGNQDSYDDCTTSCTINNQDYHAPCKRMCNNACDTDVSSGTFTGCDNVTVPAGAEGVCYVSTTFNLAPRWFAEGECLTTAQSCSGGVLCPPNVGNYDALVACPDGTTMIDRTTMTFGITVKTKVCHKTCESDAECRWNAFDDVHDEPGRYRCQTTPDSKGVKICADAQNSG